MGMGSRRVSRDMEPFAVRKLTLPDFAGVSRSKPRSYTQVPVDPVLAAKRRNAVIRRLRSHNARKNATEAARQAIARAQRLTELRTQAARLREEIDLLKRQGAE